MQKRLFLLVILLLAVIVSAQSPALPNPRLTPGEIRTTDVNAVCHGGSTKLVRHTTEAMKRQVCQAYRSKDCPHEGIMEIYHLIPLELGGADAVDNLWPQPAKPVPGFHEKDELENYLHKQVCSGNMALIDAQAEIRTNWYEAYKKYIKP